MLGNKSHRHYAHLRCESHPSIHCMTWRCLLSLSLSFSLYPSDPSSHVLLCWVLNKAPEDGIKITENVIIFKAFIPLALLFAFLNLYNPPTTS